MHRTSSAHEAIPVEDAIAALPVLPMPEPPPAVVPRWCVQAFPSVGGDSLWLTGHDGEGGPTVAVNLRLDEDREFWEWAIRKSLERRQALESGPLVAPLLRLHRP